jgi:hypothetical protein
MKDVNQLTEGIIVTVEVAAHQPWGLDVLVLGFRDKISGFVDIMYVTNNRPYNPPEDYPPVGSIRDAVVMEKRPDEKLRLSLRESDLAPARRGEPLPRLWRDDDGG